MSELLFIDVETRSRVDLKARGATNYALCPSTELLTLSYCFETGPVKDWNTGPMPAEIIEHVQAGKKVVAHNASFERLIWECVLTTDFDAPPIAPEQWLCTMYMARCNNLPATLDGLGRALKLKHLKNTIRGYQLIRALCIPDADGKFFWDDGMFQELVEYCNADTACTRDAYLVMRQPTETEWEDYYVNEEINERGIRVDVPLCQAATALAVDEHDELLCRVNRITNGEVTKVRGEKLKAWVVSRLDDDQLEILAKKVKGEVKYSLDKFTRGRLLSTELPPDVREVVECSDLAQKSSVSKFKTMADMADDDDQRIRGSLQANGASASGRYSARGCQVHNFPRKSVPDPALARTEMLAGGTIDLQGVDSIMEYLSHMLRPAIIPQEGGSFLVSDWSAIEGRVAPWLADSPLGEAKLQLYRDGQDVYKFAAARIYHVHPYEIADDSKERQVGKVAELALQYGGGVNAFQSMARGYKLEMADNEADRIKHTWREANRWARALWKATENTAIRAVRNPGTEFQVGRVKYIAAQGILAGGTTLFTILPDDRVLTYPDARVKRVEGKFGPQLQLSAMRAAWTPKVGEKEWPRASLWGGHLVENNTQAVAASLLRDALRRAREEELKVILHVHDELVLETDDEYLEGDSEVLLEIMNTGPSWAKGLPLEADLKVMTRYGK